MRHLVTIILLLTITICFAQNKDEAAILKTLEEEQRTWNAHDIEGYVNLYAPLDSTRMILSKGVAAGKQNILAFYKKYWPKEKMGTLKLDGTTMERLSKKYYYVCGYFHVTYPDGKVINGRYSSLMR